MALLPPVIRRIRIPTHMRNDHQALLEELRGALRAGDWDLAFESAYWLASRVAVVPSVETENYIRQFDERERLGVAHVLCLSFWFRLHNQISFPHVGPFFFRYWSEAFSGPGSCLDEDVWKDLPGFKIFQPWPVSKEGRWYWDGVRWFHQEPGTYPWHVFGQDDVSALGIAAPGYGTVPQQSPTERSLLPYGLLLSCLFVIAALVLRSR